MMTRCLRLTTLLLLLPALGVVQGAICRTLTATSSAAGPLGACPPLMKQQQETTARSWGPLTAWTWLRGRLASKQL
jgi:hypothetical protein